MKEIKLTITILSKDKFEVVLKLLKTLECVKDINSQVDKNEIDFCLAEEKCMEDLQNELKKEGLSDILIQRKSIAKKKIFAYFEKREHK